MNIWASEENEDLYKLPGISEKEIEKVEKGLQKKIPDSYKKIILKQNGGMIQYNSVKVISSHDKEKRLEINHIYGIGKEGLLDSDYLISEWGLPSEILIFSGDGNSFFALDYRGNKSSPSVIYLEPDTEDVIDVARTFDEFLSNLSIEQVLSEFDEDQLEEASIAEDYMTEEFDTENYLTGYSTEEAEKVFNESDSRLIIENLLTFQFAEEKDWYFKILLKLSMHQDALVRQTIVSILADNLELYLATSDKEIHHLLKEVIDNLLQDEEIEIQKETQAIKKRFK